MIVNTHMIGHLKGVRKVEIDGFVDGEWKTGIPMIEITVASESLDLDGQPTFSMDKIELESKYFNQYSPLIGKFVAVPYTLIVTQKGQKWSYDDSMPILELKEPFSKMIKVDSSSKS